MRRFAYMRPLPSRVGRSPQWERVQPIALQPRRREWMAVAGCLGLALVLLCI